MLAGSAALAVAPLALTGQFPEWGVLGFLGVIPLVFGAIGYCPPYALLGIDTSGAERMDDGHCGRVR